MKLAEVIGRCEDHSTAEVVEISASAERSVMTHARLAALARSRADQLAAAGVRQGHVIGIRAANCIDWVVWDLAAMMIGAVLQAFPDGTSLGEVDEFLERHGLALLIAQEDHPAVIPPAGPPDRKAVRPAAPRVDAGDLHSLVYSSGTAGALKGLKISKRGTEYVIDRFIESFGVTAADRHLIFLPLANYQQRLSVYCCLWLGADLVLSPYQRAFGAIRSERPTFLIGPPVFYDTALHLFRASGGETSLGDFLGGRTRFLITGMAPIRRQTLEAFWAAGVPLLEAYGMTEAGMIAWNTPDAHRVGSVGKLIDPAAVEIRPDGELLIQRPAPLSIGFLDPETTAAEETFRSDGTIATGDYGRLDAEGFLTLVGRKKDVITLGSGRKVHPAEIEAEFATLTGVEEVVVLPTPNSTRLGAIVTPATLDDPELQAAIRRQIDEVNARLDAHLRITSVIFVEQPLRANQRFMTTNMKLSRPVAAAYFAETIAARPSP